MADPKSKYVDSGAIARFKEKIVELIVALFDTKMDVDGSNSAEASEIKFGDFDSGTKSTISMKNGVLTLDADEVVKLSEEYVIPDSNNNSLVNKRYVDNTVKDIGLNFFVAEYGKSTFDEVCSAAEKGKAIFMHYAGTLIPCSYEWFGSRPSDGLMMVALVPGYSHKVFNFSVSYDDRWFNNWDKYTTADELNKQLLGKQDVLVSGTNIKTVNGNSLLGSGDLVIETGGWHSLISVDPDYASYLTVGEEPMQFSIASDGQVEWTDESDNYIKVQFLTNPSNYYTKEEVNTAIQAEDIAIKAYVDQVVGDLETRSY